MLWKGKPRAWHGSEREVAQSLTPLAGDSDSLAFAINRLRAVAGVSFGAGSETAVLWDSRRGSRKPLALPPLAGDSDSAARAINDAGQVAGFSGGDDRHTAVLWRTSGRPGHGR